MQYGDWLYLNKIEIIIIKIKTLQTKVVILQILLAVTLGLEIMLLLWSSFFFIPSFYTF